MKLSIFPPLPLPASPQSLRRLRVCIVSPEFVGPSQNGGIGTAYTALADALADAGHTVTCLYSKGAECASHDIQHWVREYRTRGIELVPLPKLSVSLDASVHGLKSYEVYDWLKAQPNFDFIHFPEWQALGYHTVTAKSQGLAFSDTRLCVGLHSMTEWLKFANKEYYSEVTELELDYLEQRSVALADVVISPSQYLLNFVTERGWSLPAQCFVQQNIMPRSAMALPPPGGPTGSSAVQEIVFFGRLETRKGVVLFCDALDQLVTEPIGTITKVSFLGKDATVAAMRGSEYVRDRAKKWPWKIELLTDRNQPQALEYLRGPGRLAVIPSLIENSPYTVLECLGAGIALLASRVGGIPELVDPSRVDDVCFEPRPSALAGKLSNVLKNGVPKAATAIDAVQNRLCWVDWHAASAPDVSLVRHQNKSPDLPTVTVCITTFNRPSFLRQALSSVRSLRYENFDVVLVDDGSSLPEARAYLKALEPEFVDRGWTIVRQENRYLGAARNAAARNATGEYLLFMDDDNCAEPHELDVLVKVALHTNADIVSCGMNYFSGQEAPNMSQPPTQGRWLPLGPSVSVGAFRNCYGDANALVRRSAFEKLGGFTEDYGVTHEDWEFLAKAAIAGFTIQVVPEFLFWYRANAGSMIRSLEAYPNYMRSIRPYVAAVPPEFRQLVLYAQGAAQRRMDVTSDALGYVQMTLRWKSKLEAALILQGMGHAPVAMKTMLEAIKAVDTCPNAMVVLEALVEIGSHLARHDLNRARYLLELAIKMAEPLKQPRLKERASQALAQLTPVRRVSNSIPRGNTAPPLSVIQT